MNRTLERTLQAGAALGIVVAVLVVTGALSRAQALNAARDVGLLIVLLTGACCALIALLGLGKGEDAQ